MREAIQLAEIKDVTPKIDVVVDSSDIQALQKAMATEERRSRLRFTALGIPNGAELRFTKNAELKCFVVSDGKVDYNGQVISPSAAALISIKSLGYNWGAVSGSDYWEFEGETLTARRLRLEDV